MATFEWLLYIFRWWEGGGHSSDLRKGSAALNLKNCHATADLHTQSLLKQLSGHWVFNSVIWTPRHELACSLLVGLCGCSEPHHEGGRA